MNDNFAENLPRVHHVSAIVWRTENVIIRAFGEIQITRGIDYSWMQCDRCIIIVID